MLKLHRQQAENESGPTERVEVKKTWLLLIAVVVVAVSELKSIWDGVNAVRIVMVNVI